MMADSDAGHPPLDSIRKFRRKRGRFLWCGVLLLSSFGFITHPVSSLFRFHNPPVYMNEKPNAERFQWPDLTLCQSASPLAFWKYAAIRQQWSKLRNQSLTYEQKIGRGLNSVVQLANAITMSSLDPTSFYFHDATAMVFDVSPDAAENSGELQVLNRAASDRFHFKYREMYYPRLATSKFPFACLTFNLKGLDASRGEESNETETGSFSFYLVMDSMSYRLFNSFTDNRNTEIFISKPGYSLTSSFRIKAGAGSTLDLFVQSSRHLHIDSNNVCIRRPFEFELSNFFGAEGTRRFKGNFEDCRSWVQQQAVVSSCQCFDSSLPLFKLNAPLKLCLNMSLYSSHKMLANEKCRRQTRDSEETRQLVQKTCHPYRKKECNELKYRVSHDRLQWTDELTPSREDFLQMLAYSLPNYNINSGQDSQTFLRQNLLKLNVMKLSEFGIVIFQEIGYKASDLAFDVFSFAGFWLALCVVCFMEMF